jgi:putative tricarboxylic transport membrane protein
MIENLSEAFQLFFNFYNFFFIFAGVFMGLIMSAIPGLTGIMAIALVIPLTYYMPPVPAIAMLLGAYKGSNIGGAFPAILLNTPGTPDAAPTTLDGFPLAKKGKAVKAMKMATYASVSADIISDTFLVIIAPPLAYVAIKMGPVEMTGLLCFAMLIIILVAGSSMAKGLVSAGLGLLLGTVGLDPITASERFCFIPSLDEGFSVIPMLIGLFAISEIFVNAERKMVGEKELIYKNSLKPEDNKVSLEEMKKSAKTIGISALIGTILGAIPGIGPTISAFVSYARAKNMSPNPEAYGKGELNGLAATQAGNSAVGGANLIPLLALGIPGDLGAAVLLGAFMLQGLHPGPLLFSNNMDIILSLFMSLFAASIITLIMSLWFIKVAGKVSKIPKSLIFSGVMVFCIVGAYGINQNMFDVWVAFGFGVLGYLMKKFDFSAAALLIAFILEPMLESSFRGSMILSHGSYTIFFSHPISLGLLIATAICLILILRHKQKNKA